ncbi:MAG: formyltransferase family protein [Phycisphaerae bacterium]
MRTVLITNGNLLSLLSLGDWLRRHHAHLAAVLVTTRLPSQKNNVVGVLSMLRASGWGYTHFKLLTNVLLPRKLRRMGLPASVEDYLRRLGSPADIWPTPYVNRPEVVERVRSLKPEILMSFSATTRFKDPLLETPTRAAINTHYALLPAYAGLSPYFWYLRNRERECGVTLHRIVPKLDAGPIIEQQRFSTAGLRTVFAVLREQIARVSPMLNRYYANETSEHNATPQDLSRRSYFGHPTRADVRALRAGGHTFYDRSDLDAVIERLRGLTS